MIIELPWPPHQLNPNKRLHWAVKRKFTKGYRASCFFAVIDANIEGFEPGERLPVKVTFHPPDRRKRDRDNMIAAFKAGQDGLADALGIDDAILVPTYDTGDPVKGGRVVIELNA